eukprot:5949883-Lingulodinium_polyedra.AAC.1
MRPQPRPGPFAMVGQSQGQGRSQPQGGPTPENLSLLLAVKHRPPPRAGFLCPRGAGGDA